MATMGQIYYFMSHSPGWMQATTTIKEATATALKVSPLKEILAGPPEPLRPISPATARYTSMMGMAFTKDTRKAEDTPIQMGSRRNDQAGRQLHILAAVLLPLPPHPHLPHLRLPHRLLRLHQAALRVRRK